MNFRHFIQIFCVLLHLTYLVGCTSKQPSKTVPANSSGNGEKQTAQEAVENNDAIKEKETSSTKPPQSDQRTATNNQSNLATVPGNSISQTSTNEFLVAVNRDNIGGVRDYLQKGGDINAGSYVTRVRSPEMLEVFIENNADLNARGLVGETALIKLIKIDLRETRIKMVRMLLENEADPDKRDRNNALIYTNVISRHDPSSFPYRSIRLADLREGLDRIHASDHPDDLVTEVARNLVSSQNDTEEIGVGEPRIIPRREQVRIVRYYIANLILTEMLLKYEADVNQVENPIILMLASYTGFIPAIEMLIENGAGPKAKTDELEGIYELAIRDAMRTSEADQFLSFNYSPMLCASVTPENSQEITEILITAGAEPLTEIPEQEQIGDIIDRCTSYVIFN